MWGEFSYTAESCLKFDSNGQRSRSAVRRRRRRSRQTFRDDSIEASRMSTNKT